MTLAKLLGATLALLVLTCYTAQSQTSVRRETGMNRTTLFIQTPGWRKDGIEPPALLRTLQKLVLHRPQIDANAVRTPRGFRVTLSSDKLGRAVYLSTVNQTGTFTENYFDLIPGKSVVTEFRTAASISPAQFRERLKIRSLADAF
jgi:Ig-like domain-containing protein